MHETSGDEKGYSIRFEARDAYLYAFVTGPEDTLDVSTRYWAEVIAEAQRVSASRLLVEEDFPGVLDTFDMYALASALADMGLGKIRVAFVDRRLEQQDLNRFGETVANNRGVQGRVFDNPAEAERWLVGE